MLIWLFLFEGARVSDLKQCGFEIIHVVQLCMTIGKVWVLGRRLVVGQGRWLYVLRG